MCANIVIVLSVQAACLLELTAHCLHVLFLVCFRWLASLLMIAIFSIVAFVTERKVCFSPCVVPQLTKGNL